MNVRSSARQRSEPIKPTQIIGMYGAGPRTVTEGGTDKWVAKDA